MTMPNFLNKPVAVDIVKIGVLVVGTVGLRLLPHPANVAPVAAASLLAGVIIRSPLAMVVPLIIMGVSDQFIGVYKPEIMVVVYASFVGSVLLGRWLKNSSTVERQSSRTSKKITHAAKVARVAGASLVGSLLFYLATNAAVWAFGTMYAPGLGGLLQSYIAGLPFLRNTVLGDLFYTSVYFTLALGTTAAFSSFSMSSLRLSPLVAKLKDRAILWSKLTPSK